MRGRLSLWVVLGALAAVAVVWGCQDTGSTGAGKGIARKPVPTAADPVIDDILGQVSKAPVKIAKAKPPVKVAEAPKAEPPKVAETPKAEPPKTEPPKVAETPKAEPPKPEPPKVAEAPKAEPPKPAVVDDKQTRAQKLLSDMEQGVARPGGAAADPEAAAKAEAVFAAGKRLYDDVRYEEALDKFNEALRIYPRHQAAAEYAAKTRGILGMGIDPMRRALESLEVGVRVQVQESLSELQNLIDEGNRSRAEARAARPGDEAAPRDKVLSRQLSAAEKALGQYDRALEIIRWLPYQIDAGSLRKKVEVSRADAEGRAKELRGDLAAFQRQRAEQESAAAREREQMRFQQTISAMLERVEYDIRIGKYEEAEGVCGQILKLDPNNSKAVSLRERSRDARHKANEARTYLDRRIELASTMQAIEDAGVAYSRTVVYPDNWHQVMQRTPATGTTDSEVEWMTTIRRKLDKKIKFDFDRAKLSEAIDFLERCSDVNMVIDPAAKAGGEREITLRMDQASVQTALDWILRLAGLDYELRDNAVFISTPDNLRPDLKTIFYDVQDLTLTIPDFPGPEMDLSMNTGGGAGGGALPVFGAAGGAGAAATTSANIVDMIKQRVRPESWGAGKGEIEDRNGKLVVRQRPEIHRMISSLLADLRQTQKIMVVVEGRLLSVREGLFEDIGVNWGHLGGNNTLNSGLVHRRGVATTQAALINNNLGYSPEGTPIGDAIQARNPVWQGGLSGQIDIVNSLQLEIMFHALRIKENSSLLQAPKLVVHNGQRAHMWIGTQISYVSGQNAAGTTGVNNNVSQLLTGVVFDVKPIVSYDRRYITLEMRPTFTTLLALNQNISTQVIITDPNDPNNPPVNTPVTTVTQLPEVQVTRVRTSVTIPDGGIILMGGRMHDVQYDTEAGFPVLKDVPFLGRAFRWNRKDNERENLAILVTARSLLFEEEERRLY